MEEQEKNTDVAENKTADEYIKDLVGDDNDSPTPEPVSNNTSEEPQVNTEKATEEPSDHPLKMYMEKLGYEIPEEVDFENEDEAIAAIKEHNKPKDEEDPFIKEYKERKEAEGFSQEEFLKQKMERMELKNLNSDDGLKKYLSMIEENGEKLYTDDDIDEFLTGKSKIEKDQMWKSVKEKITDPEPQPQKTTSDNYVEKYNKETVNQLLETATGEIKDSEDIYGLPYGEAERAKFDQKFKELMSIDAKGEPLQVYPKPVLKIINDPKELYKLLYVYDQLKSGKFDLSLKEHKDNTSEEALSKMGVSRKQTSGEYRATAPPPKSEDFV
jgi:hypothetical protein